MFNLALLEHAIKSDCYTFHIYKVSKLNRATAKRALSKADIQNIMEYQDKSPMEQLAVDLFTFSYLCAGINFIDMAKLKQSNIQENQLVYNREKTKKLIIVPLQEPAKQIIEKYNNGKSPFIFPILSNFHKSEVQIANRLHKVLAKINKRLKEIGVKLNLPIPLTTYVARHTFATMSLNNHVPLETVQKMLGHTDIATTQIYATMLDQTVSEDMERMRAKFDTMPVDIKPLPEKPATFEPTPLPKRGRPRKIR